MTSITTSSKLHQTYHQAKKIRRHLRNLRYRGVSRCFVVSGYPKSGNTWLARMLADIAKCQLGAYLTDVKERLPRETGLVGTQARPDTLVLKSHHSLPLLRLGGVRRSSIVAIFRDPRDIAVSGAGFFFGKKNVPTPETIDLMIDRMVEEVRPSVKWEDQRWDRFVESSLDRGVPVVEYNDLLTDPQVALETTLQEWGLRYRSEDIARIVRYHSFAATKERFERQGYGAGARHLRSGRTGEFRKYLSAAQIRRIESEFGPLMRRLGYI